MEPSYSRARPFSDVKDMSLIGHRRRAVNVANTDLRMRFGSVIKALIDLYMQKCLLRRDWNAVFI